MEINESLFNGHENTRLVRYDKNMPADFPNTIAFENLSKNFIAGVMKANRYVNGKLMQTYSKSDTHNLVIAATRQGKTVSGVIPQCISFATQLIKRSMIISDPKGELFRLLSVFFKEQGYDVLLLNFRDYTHSECWNPLIPIFRKYKRAQNIESEVEIVETDKGLRNKFQNIIYDNQTLLDEAIEQMKQLLLADVDSEIDKLLFAMIPPDEAKDQYWNDASRQYGKAHLWAMLEDSDKRGTKITEDTFSFNTWFTIIDSLTEDKDYDDYGYFSRRGKQSKAYNYAKGIIENASSTRQCIVSNFSAKVQVYRSSTIRLITGCSSFEMERLTQEKPVVVFISYPDETKVYYQLISTFLQSAYTYLINYANEKPNGKLDVPFYFMCEEFANLAKFPDFDSVISACGGRNIWFYIVLQSYAQLDNVYGKNIAEIIRDNLNCHIFFGSNNPSTLEAFSKECGYATRLSPKSALNGNGKAIDHFEIETLPVVTKSMLANLQPGECVVTEANCGYVLFSKMERYYLCKEYAGLKTTSEKDYIAKINPLDKKYSYSFKPPQKNESGWF